MTSTIQIPRAKRLRAWMVERDITNVAVAKELGVSHQRIALLFRRDEMPITLHEKCLVLGFPEELLPMPSEWPRTRKSPKPLFPGLLNQAVEQAET